MANEDTQGLPVDIKLQVILERLKEADRRADERKEEMCDRFERVELGLTEVRTDVSRLRDKSDNLQEGITHIGIRQGEVHADMISRIQESDQHCEERDNRLANAQDEIDARLRSVETGVTELKTSAAAVLLAPPAEVTQPSDQAAPQAPAVDPLLEEKKKFMDAKTKILLALAAAITAIGTIVGLIGASKFSGAAQAAPPAITQPASPEAHSP